MADNVKKEQALQMYAESEMSVADICTEVGIYPPQLYQWIAKEGINKRGRKSLVLSDVESSGDGVAARAQRVTDTDRELIVKMYEIEGFNGLEISKKKGFKYSTVLRVLHDARVTVVPGRRPGKLWTKGRKEILEDFNNPRMTLEDIQIKHGITLGSIYKAARKEASVLSKLIKVNRWGRNEAIVEEVLRRIKEDLASEGGMPENPADELVEIVLRKLREGLIDEPTKARQEDQEAGYIQLRIF